MIGEGERTGAPRLSAGDAVGTGDGPVCDLGVGGRPRTGHGRSRSRWWRSPWPGRCAVPPPAAAPRASAGRQLELRRRRRHHPAGGGEPARGRRGQACGLPDLEVAVLGEARHPGRRTRSARPGRVRALQGGGIAGAIAAARPRARWTCCWAPGAAEGHRRGRPVLPGWVAPAQLCSDGVDGPPHPRPGARRARPVLRHRGHHRRAPARRPVPPGRATTWSVVLSSGSRTRCGWWSPSTGSPDRRTARTAGRPPLGVI
ncbi:fructose-bisphosphatase class II family protein [Pseudonocardia sp. MCCB 268]|nr:fructose-bisphosphatase class II family protein [Pseudonocardia cytotoxica]